MEELRELIQSLSLCQLFIVTFALIFSTIIFIVMVWQLSLLYWRRKLKDKRYDELYPVLYNGKYWKRKECDDVFTSFYHSVYSLNPEGGVYLSNKDWVYPDGKIEEY